MDIGEARASMGLASNDASDEAVYAVELLCKVGLGALSTDLAKALVAQREAWRDIEMPRHVPDLMLGVLPPMDTWQGAWPPQRLPALLAVGSGPA